MTRMCLTTLKGLHYGVLALAMILVGMSAAEANDYRGGGWHHHPTPTPTPTPTPSASASSQRQTITNYRSGYRNGRSGYSTVRRHGLNNNTGYRGASVVVNTPHRSDWTSKLRAQRQWDNMQYQKMQKEDANNVRCGLSNAPAYCYRLEGPYPTEMRVVRY